METTSLTFGSPLWLWALALLPVAAGVFVWSHRRGRELVQRIVAPRLREQLAGSVSLPRRMARAVLLLSALGFAFVALAQPRYGFIERETKQEGRDVIVAIDTSKSMLATDIAPSRLVRAKMFTQDLLRLLHGDRMGLIAFAGSSFLQAPLTLDYTAVTNALEELDTSIIPRGGTNIAAAISAAREAFGKAEGQVRALVVLTDGEELDADGIAAAKKAEAEGIRIFTVGIGSPEGSLIPVTLPDGRRDVVRDNAGKPVMSKLDESRLKEISAATGGFYTSIGPDAARTIFQEGIEPMERAEMGVFSARQPIERFQWPLAAAVASLTLSLLPGDRRRVPKVAALLLLAAMPAQAQSGLDDFQNGNYEKASEAFQEGLKTQPGSHKLQFNAGAAAYKTGDFENAVTHFTDALLAGDRQLKEDASYNLANALVRKGEAATEAEAKKTNWKSAIEHYEETLRLNPENKKAQDNLEITKKLLEDLEKQQPQQDQQNDQQQDQNKDQQDQKDQEQQKNDQQQDGDSSQDKQEKDQQEKDQQQQDQQENKDQQQEGENEDQKDGDQQQEDKDQQPQDGDSKNESDNGDSDQRPEPVPTPTPGEKKEGELKSSGEQPQPTPASQDPAEAAEAAAAEEKEGEISPNQARALLNSLRGEEQKVNLMEQQTSQEVLRDW